MQYPRGMKSVAAAALAVAISTTTGCAVRGEYRGVAYVVDGSAIALGTAMALADEPSTDSRDSGTSGSDGSGAGGTIVLLPLMAMNEVGVAIAVAGLVGAAVNYAKNTDYVAPDDRAAAMTVADVGLLPELPGADPEAVRMTKQARRAALAGTCQQVHLLAPMVFRRDARYYVAVFREDPPLRACL